MVRLLEFSMGAIRSAVSQTLKQHRSLVANIECCGPFLMVEVAFKGLE